jgi:hypothetical protein
LKIFRLLKTLGIDFCCHSKTYDFNSDVTQRSPINFPTLFQSRRPCPQCRREDRVYRGDLLFHKEIDFVTGINGLHVLFFPRLTSFLATNGLIRFSSLIYIVPGLTILTFSVPFFAFLPRRNRLIIFLTGVLGVSRMIYQFITGVFALKNDIENDNCGSVIRQHVGNQSRFCFFRSGYDVFMYVYICVHEH